jgi:hypothetical protein
VTTLVRAHGDTVCVLVDRGQYDVIDTTIVAQVHDLDTLCLD